MTKILLVEDDKSLREIYGVRLLAEGYDIVSAGDGEEALAMAIKDRPDLIVNSTFEPVRKPPKRSPPTKPNPVRTRADPRRSGNKGQGRGHSRIRNGNQKPRFPLVRSRTPQIQNRC